MDRIEEGLGSMRRHINSAIIRDEDLFNASEKMCEIENTLEEVFAFLGVSKKRKDTRNRSIPDDIKKSLETTMESILSLNQSQNALSLHQLKPVIPRAKPAIGDTVFLHFSGACRGSTGPSGGGFVISKSITEDLQVGEIIEEESFHSGENNTDNQAEYLAIIAGVKACLNKGFKNLKIYGNSKLIIDQLNRDCRTKDDKMKELARQARHLLAKLDHYELKFIPKFYNGKASELSKKGIYLG